MAFTAAASSHPVPGPGAPRLARTGPPVFLVGAERSGTTLLGLMLAHHPELAWGGEMEYVVDLLPDGGGVPDVAAFRSYLRTQWKFRVRGLTADPSLGYRELVDSFLEQVRGRSDRPRVGATVHRRFDRLPDLWPDALFVHLIRDPRDVARSAIRMGWAGDAWHASELWVDAERTWDRLKASLPRERWFELRYEELLESPRARLEALCQAIGLRFDPAMLSYPEDSTYDAPDPSLAYQWRSRAEEREVRLIETRVGPLLEARGYAPSGLPPLELAPFEERLLRLENWWSRLRIRLDRFGLGLTVAEVLTRRLGLAAVHDPIQRRIQDLQIARLK